MEMFKILAWFAFSSYHGCESRRETFFNEDIPKGLIHFGFMNESTEMYAGKRSGANIFISPPQGQDAFIHSVISLQWPLCLQQLSTSDYR